MLIQIFNLYVNDNLFTSLGYDQILSQLVTTNVNGGNLYAKGQITQDGVNDYNTLITRGWNLMIDLPTPSGNGKLRVKGINTR